MEVRNRSSNGCWTCRLRRKKCDENRPGCEKCAALQITCHYGEKPEWMDGSKKQEEMLERLKQEVKEQRRGRWEVRESPPAKPCKAAKIDRSDTVLMMFYLDHVFPFMFPFYRPPLDQGGRAWILEMMMNSPVVRQAMLCQSSYFFPSEVTHEAFEVLREALKVINGSGCTEHLHGSVRILAGIMQVQRFEITVLSFENCRAHLNAGLALFEQLVEGGFDQVLDQLGPGWVSGFPIPSAEQAAFRFSSALLILDDIVASTVSQERPRLYEYHSSLLDGCQPQIDLEKVVGCQNWVLRQIGEIAVLDEWKRRCKEAGNLDYMKLVEGATAIKRSLEWELAGLKGAPKEGSSLDVMGDGRPVPDTSLVTRVWAHSTFIYLFNVVSGWQPANEEVRSHVDEVIELLKSQTTLLRAMVWPFLVAGCFADTRQEEEFREMVERLQPPRIFGTVRKALEIMENIWEKRQTGDLDLATCFEGRGDLVLLV